MLPPPLPPPPPLIPSEHEHSISYSTSILVIAALISFAIVVIASIHFLLRFLSRSSPAIHHHISSSSSSSTTSPSPRDPDLKAIVDSYPMVSFSSMAASSSLDCAVCLSPFELRDRIRLLPSCRHAFHSQCIDTWLRSSGSTLSCPLCRSSVLPPPHPPPDIGGSRRAEEPYPPLGHSFEYVAGDEADAVLSRIRRAEKSESAVDPPPPPGDAVAEVAGEGGGSRNWLRGYVDRLASSASTRWSRRFDSGNGGVGENWDLERNPQLHSEEEDDGGISSYYRWLVGV